MDDLSSPPKQKPKASQGVCILLLSPTVLPQSGRLYFGTLVEPGKGGWGRKRGEGGKGASESWEDEYSDFVRSKDEGEFEILN